MTSSDLMSGGRGRRAQGAFSEEAELEAKSKGGEVNRQRLRGQGVGRAFLER